MKENLDYRSNGINIIKKKVDAKTLALNKSVKKI